MHAASPQPATTASPLPLPPHHPTHGERGRRRTAGPEDRALYRCDCGQAFIAAVSTTVACPRCGGGQAW